MGCSMPAAVGECGQRGEEVGIPHVLPAVPLGWHRLCRGL